VHLQQLILLINTTQLLIIMNHTHTKVVSVFSSSPPSGLLLLDTFEIIVTRFLSHHQKTQTDPLCCAVASPFSISISCSFLGRVFMFTLTFATQCVAPYQKLGQSCRIIIIFHPQGTAFVEQQRAILLFLLLSTYFWGGGIRRESKMVSFPVLNMKDYR